MGHHFCWNDFGPLSRSRLVGITQGFRERSVRRRPSRCAPPAVPELGKPRRLRRRRLYFPHCAPPAIGARLMRERWARAGPKHGNPTCPPCFPAINRKNSAFGSQSTAVDRLKGKSGSLPYDSGRLGQKAFWPIITAIPPPRISAGALPLSRPASIRTPSPIASGSKISSTPTKKNYASQTRRGLAWLNRRPLPLRGGSSPDLLAYRSVRPGWHRPIPSPQSYPFSHPARSCAA